MKIPFLNKKRFKQIDWVIVAIIFAICIFSIIAIANATSDPFTGDESTLSDVFAKLDFTYVRLQAIWIAVGVIALIVAMIPDYGVVCDFSKFIYWGSIGLLFLVFLTSEVRGMVGWFRFGERGFQPSEVAKIALIIILAKMFSDKTAGKRHIKIFREIIPIGLTFSLPFGLILVQKDWGTALVYLVIFAGMLFVSKTDYKVILIVIGIGLVMVPVAWLVMNDIQRNRILTFLNPDLDPQGAGWQVSQAKLAIGSGGFFGKGLMAAGALGPLNYIPDSHTDFIFGVTTEAVGFIGSFFLIVLYAALLLRSLRIANRAKDDEGAFLIVGVVCMTMFHIFENIGMNLGLMPVTGIPLPFFSYGGSNMLTNMIAFGIVLNVNMRRFRWSVV